MINLPTERVVPTHGSPLGDRAAVAIVGDRGADVAREALRIARAESLSRPVLLVDLLGQGSALDEMFADDDPHGVSDAARYGISLSRVARPVPNADTLFVVPGGLESPQADDVLSDHMWGSWSDQCRKSGALLVVAAPADLPSVGKAIDQLDGVVMIGDALLPNTQAPIIGRITIRRRRPTGAAEPRQSTAEELSVVREATKRPPWRLAMAVVAGLLAVSAGVWWLLSSGLLGAQVTAGGAAARGGAPIVMPGDTAETSTIILPAPEGVAEWAVELASVSSMTGALARVRQSLDVLPVPTFAPAQPGTSLTLWYRLIAGAFTSMDSADSLLAALRDRGVIEAGGGRVVRAPLGWLLEEDVGADELPERLFAWRQQGLPAYALLDSAGRARVYVGAFESEVEGRLFLPVLDSLNLHATLALRVGSLR